jgi:hypothetical protein
VASEEKTPSIQVESNRVAFELTDGRMVRLPPGYGTFHDPSGKAIGKCEVYFGPYKKTGRRVEMNQAQRRYFGPDHKAFLAEIPKLRGLTGWKQVGRVAVIYYVRRGHRARGGFHHPFKSKNPTLSKSGKLYKLSLGNCLVDDRGYVYP